MVGPYSTVWYRLDSASHQRVFPPPVERWRVRRPLLSARLRLAAVSGVAVWWLKEEFKLNGDDMQSKVLRTMLGLFAEIERDLISTRTKEGLQAARASGKKLGRPKGPGKSKLDPYEPEIIAMLKNGTTKKFIAERYHVAPAAVTLRGTFIPIHAANRRYS